MVRDPLFVRPDSERAHLFALVARSAAGMGDRLLYEEAFAAAWTLLDELPDGESPASALAELARAASLLDDRPRAEEVARLGHRFLPVPPQDP